MITVRQIERQWDARAYGRLFAELVTARPERTLRLGIDAGHSLPAAAMALIRLDELSQSHVKLYSKLLKTILTAQESDGGWGDLVTTALCLRALLCGGGNGESVERALAYLAGLQKAEGVWPNIPIRRMPADAYVSALLLYQLGEQASFRRGVRVDDAVRWFQTHEHSLDGECKALWERARVRCGMQTRQAMNQPELSYS
jgi:hypothetical protein